jgi:hypothetical protein
MRPDHAEAPIARPTRDCRSQGSSWIAGAGGALRSAPRGLICRQGLADRAPWKLRVSSLKLRAARQ